MELHRDAGIQSGAMRSAREQNEHVSMQQHKAEGVSGPGSSHRDRPRSRDSRVIRKGTVTGRGKRHENREGCLS